MYVQYMQTNMAQHFPWATEFWAVFNRKVRVLLFFS